MPEPMGEWPPVWQPLTRRRGNRRAGSAGTGPLRVALLPGSLLRSAPCCGPGSASTQSVQVSETVLVRGRIPPVWVPGRMALLARVGPGGSLDGTEVADPSELRLAGVGRRGEHPADFIGGAESLAFHPGPQPVEQHRHVGGAVT